MDPKVYASKLIDAILNSDESVISTMIEELKSMNSNDVMKILIAHPGKSLKATGSISNGNVSFGGLDLEIFLDSRTVLTVAARSGNLKFIQLLKTLKLHNSESRTIHEYHYVERNPLCPSGVNLTDDAIISGNPDMIIETATFFNYMSDAETRDKYGNRVFIEKLYYTTQKSNPFYTILSTSFDNDVKISMINNLISLFRGERSFEGEEYLAKMLNDGGNFSPLYLREMTIYGENSLISPINNITNYIILDYAII